jgi:hypothetical protein
MNIVLNKSVSVSETEMGIRKVDIIYPNNQLDSTKDNRLFITCEGNSTKSMIAGRLLCDSIQTYFHSFSENGNAVTPLFIEKSIRFGEISLSEFQKENPEARGMSSVLCLIYFSANCVYFAQIGKSHIYQIRNNQIVYKSIDASPDRKVWGTARPADVNVVKLKDIQANDYFFVYSGEFNNFQEERYICQVLSEKTSSENKLAKIKNSYLSQLSGTFSAHLIPVRKIANTHRFKNRLNLLN